MARFGQTVLDLQGCGAILTAGSCLAVGSLPNCVTEAPEYVITAPNAVAIGDEVITGVTVTTTTGDLNAVFGEGKLLYFNGNSYKVTANTTIVTDGVATADVPIEAAEVAIAANDTATSWMLLDLLAPTDLPLNSNDTVVDITNLKDGIQGAEQKTNVMLESQVQCILEKNDPALGLIHDATQSDVLLTAVVARNGGIYAIGKAIFCNLQYSGNTKEVVRPQFQVKFQPPYDFPKAADQWDTATQTYMNGQLQLAGLATV